MRIRAVVHSCKHVQDYQVFEPFADRTEIAARLAAKKCDRCILRQSHANAKRRKRNWTRTSHATNGSKASNV